MSNNKIIRERILKVSKDTGIPTKKIWDFLYILRGGKPIDNNELLQKLGVSKNALNQAKEMFSDLLEAPSKNTKLKDKALSQATSLFPAEYKPEEVLWNILETAKYNQVLEILKRYEDKRPAPERKYDQFTATMKTTAKRASLLDQNKNIEGKRLLFLGDDDFTSIAVSNFRKASSITVLDIDDRIIDTIGKVAREENLQISLGNYNARKTLPDEYKQKFDVVFTDPPYTPEGIKLFVSRAIQALDSQNQSAQIYLCYGNSDRAKERFLPIYELLTSSGLMIRWVFDKFNRYNGAESIGSASSLFVLEITLKTKALVTGNYDKPIYTNN
jgi:predicted methyltransferase